MGKSGLIFYFIAALLAFAVIQTGSLYAQVVPGDRVRLDIDTVKSENIFLFFSIKVPERTKVIGELVDMNDTSIYIADQSFPAEVRHFRLNKVKSLYKSVGTKRSTLMGMFCGVNIGLLGAMVSTMAHPEPEEFDGEIVVRERNPNKVLLTTVGFCTVAGGVIGWFVKADKWEKIHKDKPKAKIDIGFLDNQAGVRLSLKF